MSKHAPATDGKELTKAVKDLDKRLLSLTREFEYVIHPGKHLFLTYFRGIVYGLGALTAVAIVVPLIISMLHQISWVPLVGEFVEKVILQVEMVQPR